MIHSPDSPDQDRTEYHVCDGLVWDSDLDRLTECECECHWMTKNIRTLP